MKVLSDEKPLHERSVAVLIASARPWISFHNPHPTITCESAEQKSPRFTNTLRDGTFSQENRREAYPP